MREKKQHNPIHRSYKKTQKNASTTTTTHYSHSSDVLSCDDNVHPRAVNIVFKSVERRHFVYEQATPRRRVSEHQAVVSAQTNPINSTVHRFTNLFMYANHTDVYIYIYIYQFIYCTLKNILCVVCSQNMLNTGLVKVN